MQRALHASGHPTSLRRFAVLASILALVIGTVGWIAGSAGAIHASQADASSNQAFLPLIGTPPLMGRIAFASSQGHAARLVVMRADRTGTLWTSPACGGWDAAAPVWSPDGQRLLFESNAGGSNSWICAINADGSGLTTLTGSGTDTDRQPIWSPDGQQIVFVARGMDIHDPVNPDIYRMNADGTDLHQLTSNPDSDTSPVWSGDGHDIAFVTNRDGPSHIYLMRADGSAQRRLTTAQGSESDPAWSPDGEHIAFIRIDQSGQRLFVIRRDGSSETPVTNTLNASRPLWSPNGTRIAFLSDDLLYVVNADGTGVHFLARIAFVYPANMYYAWSTDSRQIVFQTNSGQDINLAIVGVDDGRQVPLTQGSLDFNPAWTR